MYLDHLKLYVVCINGRRYGVVNVNVLSLMSPPPNLCNLVGAHGVEVRYFGCFASEVSLVSWIVMTSACVL